MNQTNNWIKAMHPARLCVAALSIFVIQCATGPAVCWGQAKASPSFRVAGYLPDYRLASFDPKSAVGLTDLVLFSAELTSDGSLDLNRLSDVPWSRLSEYTTQQDARLILTIGGWGRSKHFAGVAASREKRQRCARSITGLCVEKRLGGVDLDWEHPKGETEERNYGDLLRELHAAFAPHDLVLSVTIAPWQRLPAAAVDSVDYVQVMAYDHPGKHATFAQIQDDLTTLIDSGLPAQKIVLGLPFYGRNIKTRKAMSYAEIVAKHDPAPSIDQVDGIFFNGPDTIRRKVNLALRSQLGGVMVWELGQDARSPHSLLQVIQETVAAADK